jgi:hypothetical protein
MPAPLEPLSNVLNRPSTKLGVEHRFLFAPPGAAVLCFIVGLVRFGALGGLLSAIAALVAIYGAASWLASQDDPALVKLAINNLFQKTEYDPFH